MDFVELARLLGAALSAGGDIATIGVAYALWRLDRRVLRVEIAADEASRSAARCELRLDQLQQRAA